jgi:hypothetical protein
VHLYVAVKGQQKHQGTSRPFQGNKTTEPDGYISLSYSEVMIRNMAWLNEFILTAAYDHTSAGFNGLGKRGKPAEEVAGEVCRELIKCKRCHIISTKSEYLYLLLLFQIDAKWPFR